MTSWAMDALPLWEHESWLSALVSVKTISGGYDTDHQKIIPFNHDVKFHHLDTLVNEDNGFKHDIELIKEFMEERKQKAEARDQCHDKEFSTDDDNTRSIATRVGKDEKATAKHEDHRRSSLEATQTKVDNRHDVHQVAIEEAIESWKKGVEGNCRRSKDTGMWRRIVCVTLGLEREMNEGRQKNPSSLWGS
ncbi:hypothetical protein BJ322DRAFT_1021091 [Thelephora terrestris]|uniref:Uncharacterized protein n=1 Tax=Thelephora terrestris TaxID=56493 RepID=A0A9P6H2H0_9AGAM|nr:hypothetical protein BJ322DRAFT_1025545 [Thelephora terrestris]KAF9784306.1 hypothetical protein BJ322DRAFT_1021091 [Thelephora terrestris]